MQKQDYQFFSWMAIFGVAGTLLCAIGSWFDGIDGLAVFFLLFSIVFLVFKTSLDNDAAKQH